MKKLAVFLLALLLSASVLSPLQQAVCYMTDEPELIPVVELEPGEPVGLNDSGDMIGPSRNDT